MTGNTRTRETDAGYAAGTNGSSPASRGHILSVEGLTVSFDGFTVLDALDFTMDYGEMRFLIGPNGAGKTTLIDVITGKARPDRGRVMFDGRIDLARRQEHDLVRLGVGRKFQTPAVFPSLTVFENLEVSAGFRSGGVGLFRPCAGATSTAFRPPWSRWGWPDRPGNGQASCPTGRNSG